jgi:hypothetical protein
MSTIIERHVEMLNVMAEARELKMPPEMRRAMVREARRLAKAFPHYSRGMHARFMLHSWKRARGLD